MAQRALSKDKTYDWVTLSVYFSLVVVGWFMVFSTLYTDSNPYAFLDIKTPLGAQTTWVVLSIFSFVVVLTIDWKFWNALAFPIYGFLIFLLILVLFLGKEINGAKAWFRYGFFSFQPAEWAKFGTAIAVASYLSFFKSTVTDVKVIFVSLLLFLGPAFLILLQPDFGSSIVYLSFFILLYRRGQSPWVIISGIGAAAIFILSLIYGPFLVTVFLLFLGFGVFIFDLESPRKATSIFLLLLV